MSEIHLSASAIARLTAVSVQAAHKALRRGHYGPPVWRGHRCYAALAAVERHAGQPFTPQQIACAVASGTDRMIVVAPPVED